MTSDTLRTRLSQLLTKSRKAAYLYQHTARESQGVSGLGLRDGDGSDVSGVYSRGQKTSPVTHQRSPHRFQGYAEGTILSPEKNFSHLQVVVWQHVNENLSRSLRSVLQNKVQRNLSQGALALRDELYESWRRAETELHREKSKLERAVAEEHYVRSTILAEKLITLKARLQATKAAYSEYEVAVADVARADASTGDSYGSKERRVGDNFSSGAQEGSNRLVQRGSLATGADQEESDVHASSSDVDNVLPFSESKRRSIR
ncbi:MAG: hypothetical protein ACO3XO_01675 [Bdellovibrionota bacterium]